MRVWGPEYRGPEYRGRRYIMISLVLSWYSQHLCYSVYPVGIRATQKVWICFEDIYLTKCHIMKCCKAECWCGYQMSTRWPSFPSLCTRATDPTVGKLSGGVPGCAGYRGCLDDTENIQIKVAGWSGKYLDNLKSVRIIYEMCPVHLENIRMIWKVMWWSKKRPDNLENVSGYEKCLDDLPGKYQDNLKSVRII